MTRRHVPIRLVSARFASLLLAAALLTAACGPAAPPPGQPVATPDAGRAATGPTAAPATPAAPTVDPLAVQFRHADELLAAGQPAAAANELLAILGADPGRFDAWNDLSLAYRRLGYLPAAGAAGFRAATLKPDDSRAAFNAGVALTMADHAADAIPLLQRSGNSADALYWLATAQVEAAPDSLFAAEQSLRQLLTRYPDDKEARVALAALDEDLDLDTRPDLVNLTTGRATVALTAGQTLHLTWERQTESVPTAYQILDIGAPYPALMFWSTQSVRIYLYDPASRSLQQLAQVDGSGAWNYGTKTLAIGIADKGAGLTRAEDWGWQDGRWQKLRSYTIPFKGDPEMTAASPLDLAGLLAELPVRSLFASDAAWTAYLDRSRKAGGGYGFLLPTGAGKYRVEFWRGGTVLDQFGVSLAQQNGHWTVAGIE